MSLSKSTLINANRFIIGMEKKFPVDSNVFFTTRRDLPNLALTLFHSEFFGATYLNDMFVIDNFGKTYRFLVVYRFSNLDNVVSYSVITATIEGIPVFSIENIYEAVS